MPSSHFRSVNQIYFSALTCIEASVFQARINSTGRDRVIASIEPPQNHAAKNRLVNLHSNLAVCA